ncbi:MAG TPA: hypothetical protein VHM25_18110 [Polyangiaceae bacterium]|jgi:hypothetical protein|nr:hypothetical protein [Polyangiaceae bacterium]
MVSPPSMFKARWLAVSSLMFGLAAASLGACSNGDGRPSSLVSSNGEAGRLGNSTGHGGGGSSNAGGPNGDAGGRFGDDAGAAGETDVSPAPLATYPEQLRLDVACGASPEPTELLIQNDGRLPLIVSSATTSAGYTVKGELPLRIEALGSAILLVSAAAPNTTAAVGDTSTGTLTFVTNETHSPSHQVRLDTTVFGGRLEFADRDGVALKGALTLSYLSSDVCPDSVKYRVRNTGNLAFMLTGPTFPVHLRGTTTGASGQSVAPNGYVELEVSGNSATDAACSGSGELSFTVEGSLCSAAPKLPVTWPANVATSGCSCGAASE